MRIVTSQFPYLLPAMERSTLLAYLLWLFWGFFGVHKLYLGRPVMALAYLLTGGFFGIGWVIDFFTLPWQVQWCNLRQLLAGKGRALLGGARPRDEAGPAAPKALRKSADVMMALLEEARRRGGVLSVTDGVLATRLPFARVEKVMREMLKSGYVDVRNDPETGVVQYVFHELTRPE